MAAQEGACCAGCNSTKDMGHSWHRCHQCKQPVHSRFACHLVHQGEEEEDHVCDACHRAGKDKGQRPPSPASKDDAQLLVDCVTAGEGRNMSLAEKDGGHAGLAGGAVGLPSSSSLGGRVMARVEPAESMFKMPASVPLPLRDEQGTRPRVAAKDTPRPEHALLAPPAVGTTWSFQPQVIGADGADAGPNGIIETVRKHNAAYKPLRGHCSVHKKRNIQQNKGKIFQGDHEEKESKANTLTTLMEQVKSHSITVALAELGKRKITEHLQETDGKDAADYFRKQHQDDKWTLVEMNADTAAGGGVPCTTNSIERANRDQKDDMSWKKAKVIPFMTKLVEQIGHKSMDDLEFGLTMPRGYKTSQKTKKDGTRTPVIDKTVWSVSFFDNVKFESVHPAGIQHLVWKANLPGYHAESLIMSSRKMRAWVLTDKAFAEHYGQSDDKKRCMKKAMSDNTVMDGKTKPSFVKQFQRIVKDAGQAEVSLPDLIEWQQSFHILEPITCPIYVADVLKRLRYSGLVLDTEAVSRVSSGSCAQGHGDQKQIYLYKCSCALYRHYAWCIHVMLRAVDKGLIPKPYCPATMDSAAVTLPGKGPKVVKGHPGHIKKGGALSPEDK